MDDDPSKLFPFILPWNLRNMSDEPVAYSGGRFCLTGSRSGDYPVDAWRTYYLEVPAGEYKSEIIGRMNHSLGVAMRAQEWNMSRVVPLPVFGNCADAGTDVMRAVILRWRDMMIPDDIPCVTVAARCRGQCSENIEAQTVRVLLVWSDGVTRTLDLDWTEGPWEDCVTPEWYIQASSLSGLDRGLERMTASFSNINWEGSRYSLFSLPLCLGRDLAGVRKEEGPCGWKGEWQYDERPLFESDLESLTMVVRDLFEEHSPAPDEDDGTDAKVRSEIEIEN